MASFIYGKHRERLQTAAFNWNTAPIKLAFVAVEYVPDQDADEFLTDLPATTILARSGLLIGKTATLGFAAAITPLFVLYSSGRQAVAAILFEDTGVDSTSRLICYTSDGPAFPFVGLGINYSVSYNAADGGFYRA
jgi:hypothetical protein